MNTTRHTFSMVECSATDALFDQIEQELLALTTAPLEGRATEPPQCVDEFADDFFSYWSMPSSMAPDAAAERPGLAN
ncbi:hypothetical protein ACI48D_01065 [Massilia sp. LXY-6]|uniref:hypothetical protein n=1 Tax=Massilia sp. LXY-6 TaxID=3379823 RepID=UPI003EE34ED8